VQLAVPAGQYGPSHGTDRAQRATGPNRLVVAGVAVASAGVLAAIPAALTSPGIQQRVVQLTSTDDVASDWSQIFSTAGDNLSDLSEAYTPFPILSQIGDNWSGHYADEINAALQESSDGLDKVINGDPDDPARLPGIENMLDSVTTGLQNGDAADAFEDFNIFSLEALKFVFKPLSPILGVPDEMTQNYSHTFHELFTADAFIHNPEVYDTLKEATRALSSPFIAAFYEAGYALDDPDQDPADIPAQMVDAFLNGWTYPGEDEPFPGLLTEGGLLDYLFVSFPQEVAEYLNLSDDYTLSADSLGEALDGVGVDDDGTVDASELRDALDGITFGGSGIGEDNLYQAFTDKHVDSFTGSDALNSDGDAFDGHSVTDMLNGFDFDGHDFDGSDIVQLLLP
jgi:hypothetical protein